MVEEDRYLLVKAKGGMGNRMLSAATGLLFGQLTKRKTVIDWRDPSYSDDGENAFDRFFVNSDVCPIGDLPNTDDVYPAVWQGRLLDSIVKMIGRFDPDKHSSLRIHRKYSIDVSRLDYGQRVVVFWFYEDRMNRLLKHLDPQKNPYKSQSRDVVLQRMFREQFMLQSSILERIKEYKERNWRNPVIGVHIRHTDRRVNIAKYDKPIDAFMRKYPQASIFLATDSQAIEASYRERYKDVLVTKKWFPANQQGSLHQNKECPDRYLSGVEALVDMFLLAECDCLVFPRCSTFSWISSMLSDAPPENIVDVDRFDIRVRGKLFLRELIA